MAGRALVWQRHAGRNFAAWRTRQGKAEAMDRSAFVAAMVSELKTQSIRPGGLATRKPSWERACQDLATDLPEVREHTKTQLCAASM